MIPTAARFFQFFQFSKKISPIARRLNLGLPSSARQIKGLNTTDFPIVVKISEQHLVYEQHMKYLSGPEHPLTAKFLSFYTSKPLQPLILSVYNFTNTGNVKVVVKNRAATRIRRAFCVALNKNGYSWLGVGISRELKTKGKQLYGTVNLGGQDPKRILLLEFPKLVDYFAQQIKDNIAPKLSINVTGDSAGQPREKSDTLEPGILDVDQKV
ncbi:hypothetical protein V8F33_000913 [Rhypophila sp. PSN 637]